MDSRLCGDCTTSNAVRERYYRKSAPRHAEAYEGLPARLLGVLLAILLGGCTSSTVPEERFSESSLLTAPNVAVTLADAERFSFGMVGDLHILGANVARLQNILSDANSKGVDFMILLGDIVDKGDESDFTAVLNAVNSSAYANKVLWVAGNHDVFHGGWDFYKATFGPSHYSVDLGNSRFIVLDTADGTIGDDHMQWLHGQLGRQRLTNTFVLSHYLPFIPGVRTYLKLADEVEATRAMALVARHQVRGWFGGHYHSYLRGAVDGVEYVVAGGGGGRLMPPIMANFYVQVTVNVADVNYQMVEIP